MASRAESDQKLFGIVPRLAGKLFVVNLKTGHGATGLASPAIAADTRFEACRTIRSSGPGVGALVVGHSRSFLSCVIKGTLLFFARKEFAGIMFCEADEKVSV